MKEEKREEKDGFLESSAQSASTAPINDYPWSNRAEILQGSSQHVNLNCERWRSDLEQSAVIFFPVNSSSVLGEIIL
jgi:nuclear transport factor 2 (NTF2) superfamily protein